MTGALVLPDVLPDITAAPPCAWAWPDGRRCRAAAVRRLSVCCAHYPANAVFVCAVHAADIAAGRSKCLRCDATISFLGEL